MQAVVSGKDGRRFVRSASVANVSRSPPDPRCSGPSITSFCCSGTMSFPAGDPANLAVGGAAAGGDSGEPAAADQLPDRPIDHLDRVAAGAE
jgi:hypothetical protein